MNPLDLPEKLFEILAKDYGAKTKEVKKISPIIYSKRELINYKFFVLTVENNLAAMIVFCQDEYEILISVWIYDFPHPMSWYEEKEINVEDTVMNNECMEQIATIKVNKFSGDEKIYCNLGKQGRRIDYAVGLITSVFFRAIELLRKEKRELSLSN